MNEYTYLYYHQSTLASGDARIESLTEPLSFYHNVSSTKELRDASNDAESLLLDFGVESSMRLDVFKAKMAAKENAEASGQWDKLSPEQKRLVEKMVSHSILLSHQCDLIRIRSSDLRWNSSRSCLVRGKENRTDHSQEGTLPSLLGIQCMSFIVSG